MVYAIPRILSLQAICFWCNDYAKWGHTINLNHFDHTKIVRYNKIVRVEDLQKESYTEFETPTKLTANADWENWEILMINYLESQRSLEGVPFSR